MPRSGKSSVCAWASEYYRNIVVYEERFDVVPESMGAGHTYDFNRWYLDDCVRRLECVPEEGMHVFQRAVNDRQVVGNVLFSLGFWSEREFENYSAAIADARVCVAGKLDISLLFLMDPEMTLKHTRSKKKSFTRDPVYLRALFSEYVQLAPEPLVRALRGEYSLADARAFFAHAVSQPH